MKGIGDSALNGRGFTVSQVPGYLSHYHYTFLFMNFTWTTRLLLSGCWILSSTNLDDIRLSWQFASVVDAPSRISLGHQLRSACLEKLVVIGWVRNQCAYKYALSHYGDFTWGFLCLWKSLEILLGQCIKKFSARSGNKYFIQFKSTNKWIYNMGS